MIYTNLKVNLTYLRYLVLVLGTTTLPKGHHLVLWPGAWYLAGHLIKSEICYGVEGYRVIFDKE